MVSVRTAVGRAQAARWRGARDLLRLVRRHPGITRADAARQLGLSSGSATEITARLRDLNLLDERPAPAVRRGRPTTSLHANADGPVVAVVDIRYEDWRIAIADLEGRLTPVARGRRPPGGPDALTTLLRDALREAARSRHHRLRAVSISVAATVRGESIFQVAGTGWHDVVLAPLVDPELPQLVGNDASLAGVAESRRGSASGARALLYLTIEVGVGGVLVTDGTAVAGASGAGGEFGHLPFGDPAHRCPCGANGCWDIEVDGRAMARHLGEPEPADPWSYAVAVLEDDSARSQAAVARCAAAFGRGMAGLVNALDPDLVALGGLAVHIGQRAPEALAEGYDNGLMSFHRGAPPPLLSSALGADASLLGAAEVAFDVVLSEAGLAAWAEGADSAPLPDCEEASGIHRQGT